MGIPMSILGKLGIPGVQSYFTDEVFKKYFAGKKINTFAEFQLAFLRFWTDFNEIMPGRHYRVPPLDKIKASYAVWQSQTSLDEQKKVVLNLLKTHSDLSVKEANKKALVTTGLVAPAAAMILKRAGDNVPQVKKFKIHLVPDAVFVPSCTILALIATKMIRLKTNEKRSEGSEN